MGRPGRISTARAKNLCYGGRLDGVPVLIGCHEADPHIPLARVRESVSALDAMGAGVGTMIFPGSGHGIVADEAAWLRGRLDMRSEGDG